MAGDRRRRLEAHPAFTFRFQTGSHAGPSILDKLIYLFLVVTVESGLFLLFMQFLSSKAARGHRLLHWSS